MIYGTCDDPNSQKAAGVLRYLIFFVVGMGVLFYFITMVNRLLKVETKVRATATGHQITVGRRNNTSTFLFKAADGRKYRLVIPHGPAMQKIGPLTEGQEVELVLSRGVFWTEVVEIINGEHHFKKRF
jgi:hypothetical protein